jgi:regulatory protein
MKNDKKTTEEIYWKMTSICSRAEQCPHDIYKKMATSGLTDEQADEIIKKLKEEKFIDEERYVNAFVSDKFKFNKWGKVKIRYHLKMKNLPDTLIQHGLNLIDNEKYIEVLKKTMKGKAQTVKNRGKYEKMGQIIRFAQNRGFEPELIHRYLNDIVSQ